MGSDFWTSARMAFDKWWKVIAVIAASAAGFNLLQRLADIGLSKLFTDITRVYQSIVHVPVDTLFHWAGWAQPPSWAIDVGVLWLVIGGVVFRTWLSLFGEISKYQPDFRISPQTFAMLLLMGGMLWPMGLIEVLSTPRVYRDPTTGILQNTHARPPGWTLYCDLRVSLGIQAIALATCIAAWVLIDLYLK